MPKPKSKEPVVLKRGAEESIYSFAASNAPRASVGLGGAAVFETLDCFGGQIRGQEDKFEKVGWDRINPATGPLFVEGARKGDTLCVEIKSIQVDSPGVMTAVPGLGAAGDRVKESTTTMIPIVNGLAHLPAGVILEVRPMIGVIGTSPAEGEAPVPTGTPGTHGGNMDTSVISAGSTVYLPVNVDGALLAMGDLHALMGDGEVLICGVEVSGKVTVSVDVIKDLTLPCPVVETDNAFYPVWSAATLDDAAREVVARSVDLVSRALQCREEDALALLSARANLQISQIVDPLKTVRMEIPKSVLKGRSLVE